MRIIQHCEKNYYTNNHIIVYFKSTKIHVLSGILSDTFYLTTLYFSESRVNHVFVRIHYQLWQKKIQLRNDFQYILSLHNIASYHITQEPISCDSFALEEEEKVQNMGQINSEASVSI